MNDNSSTKSKTNPSKLSKQSCKMNIINDS